MITLANLLLYYLSTRSMRYRQHNGRDPGVPAGGRDPVDRRRRHLALGLNHRGVHLRRLPLPRVHRKCSRAVPRGRLALQSWRRQWDCVSAGDGASSYRLWARTSGRHRDEQSEPGTNGSRTIRRRIWGWVWQQWGAQSERRTGFRFCICCVLIVLISSKVQIIRVVTRSYSYCFEISCSYMN